MTPYTLCQCPFCGSTKAPRVADNVELGFNDHVELYALTVLCDAGHMYEGCGASCGYHETEAEAIAAWNTRCDE